VVFYEEDDESPIEDFLRGLPTKKVRKKVWKFILLLEERGYEMPSAYAKHLTGYPLYELIIDFQNDTYRIFYFFEGRLIVLLHGFIKKTYETPRAEIDLALRRMEKWKSAKEC